MQEVQVQPWVGKTPPSPALAPEKEMATHTSILGWEIPLTVGPGKLQFMGVTEESDTT